MPKTDDSKWKKFVGAYGMLMSEAPQKSFLKMQISEKSAKGFLKKIGFAKLGYIWLKSGG